MCGKQQPKSFGVDHENHSTLALIHDKTATLRASNTFLLTYGIELGENWILPFQKAQPTMLSTLPAWKLPHFDEKLNLISQSVKFKNVVISKSALDYSKLGTLTQAAISISNNTAF